MKNTKMEVNLETMMENFNHAIDINNMELHRVFFTSIGEEITKQKLNLVETLGSCDTNPRTIETDFYVFKYNIKEYTREEKSLRLSPKEITVEYLANGNTLQRHYILNNKVVETQNLELVENLEMKKWKEFEGLEYKGNTYIVHKDKFKMHLTLNWSFKDFLELGEYSKRVNAE